MQCFSAFHQHDLELRAGDTDLTGQTFYSLTVIKPWGFKHGKLYWLCDCDCGRHAIIQGDRLIYGSAHTCGCSKVGYCKKTIEIVQARQQAVADAVYRVGRQQGGYESLE